MTGCFFQEKCLLIIIDNYWLYLSLKLESPMFYIYITQRKHFKVYKKFFLFHLKSLFHFWYNQFFVFLFPSPPQFPDPKVQMKLELLGAIHKGCPHIFSDFWPPPTPPPVCSCLYLVDPPTLCPCRHPVKKIFISKHSLKTTSFISFFSIQIYPLPIHFIL